MNKFLSILAVIGSEWPPALAKLPRRLERGGLALHQLTCVLPLASDTKDDHGLSTFLKSLDEMLSSELQKGETQSSFSRTPGLHSARLMLLDDTERLDSESGSRSTDNRRSRGQDAALPAAGGPLVLNLVYDGSVDDVLLHLLEEGNDLRPALAACEGFPKGAQARAIIAWLKRSRVRGAYFFSDIPDQSREEIDGAASLWRAFQDFYDKNQASQSTAQLRAAFKAFWAAQKQTALPISRHLERRLPDEESLARRSAELLRRMQVKAANAQKAAGAHAQRAIHAKHHGCVEAEFIVYDAIPEALKCGIFAKPATYKALIRLSNSSPVARPDAARDGRGMAIKLLGVSGAQAVPELAPREQRRAGEATQDFVLINQPNFFSADVEDFAILLGAITAGGLSTVLGLPLYFVHRPRALLALLRTLLQRVNHPLDLRYHSVTPYLLGDIDDAAAPAVKYSVRPLLGKRKTFAHAKPDRQNPNFLAQQLADTLSESHGEQVELEFRLHVSRGEQLPVEDATASWSKASVVPVAKIVIRPQDFSSVQARSRCERLEFSPWHALAVHRPLGSLNRSRLFAYRQSAELRRSSNDALFVAPVAPPAVLPVQSESATRVRIIRPPELTLVRFRKALRASRMRG